MNPTRIAGTVAVLVVFAGWALWRAWRPSPPTLASVAARYQPRHTTVPSRSPGGNLAQHVAGRLAGGVIGRRVEATLGVALRLAATTVPAVLARMVTVAAVSLLATLLVIGGLAASGALPVSPWWLAVVVMVPVLFAWQVLGEVRTLATRRRRALQRVTNDFVQLLAVALTTNRSIEEAVEFASRAGDGDEFQLLRDTVDTARPMGIPVWEALAAMADTYGLADLAALTGSLQRQAGVGVSVAETVRSEAKAMRRRQLDELTDRADKANANLSIPTMGMVLGMVLFLGYPIAQQISAAL